MFRARSQAARRRRLAKAAASWDFPPAETPGAADAITFGANGGRYPAHHPAAGCQRGEGYRGAAVTRGRWHHIKVVLIANSYEVVLIANSYEVSIANLFVINQSVLCRIVDLGGFLDARCDNCHRCCGGRCPLAILPETVGGRVVGNTCNTRTNLDLGRAQSSTSRRDAGAAL